MTVREFLSAVYPWVTAVWTVGAPLVIAWLCVRGVRSELGDLRSELDGKIMTTREDFDAKLDKLSGSAS